MNRTAYNTIAAEFHAARSRFIGREQGYLDLLLDGLPPGSSVLDLGCGTGRPMAAQVIAKGHRVIGVDQAQQAFPEQQWIQATLETYACPDDYAAVLLWDSLFHIKRSQHELILARALAGLPAGGRLMLTCGGSDHPAFTDQMFGTTFFYDSHPPEHVQVILERLGCRVLLGEFMEQPDGGRNKGRYASRRDADCE